MYMLAGQVGLLLRLSPEDNVCVLLRPLSEGDCLRIGERTIVYKFLLRLGHKVAARDINVGEKIIKYGAPIGSAVCQISLGDHVHLHNIKSDYIATYTLESEAA